MDGGIGMDRATDVRLAQCFIAVDDHDKALAFYCDVLGFEVRNDVGFEGMRWVTVGSPDQDVEIVLEPPAASPDASPADKQAMAELLAKGMLRGVNFTTTDCERPLRAGAGRGRRRAPGAGGPAVRDAGLRVSRPGRQHGALPGASGGLSAGRLRTAASTRRGDATVGPWCSTTAMSPCAGPVGAPLRPIPRSARPPSAGPVKRGARGAVQGRTSLCGGVRP
ncbi:hypothetical protein STENM223S_04730 [Streptomyces tendae]